MSMVFLTGEFVEEENAKVSINDAGYYFGDGIYEVVLVNKGKLVDVDEHLKRLFSCFEKVYFKNYPSKELILEKMNELVKKHQDIEVGSIYIQFTRGNTKRSHSFIDLDLQPNWMMKFSPFTLNKELSKTWRCMIVNDPRRTRCDIKMISLLPMVLSKYECEKSGFDDVIYYNNRVNSITEGSSFNVFIVDENNTIITYPLSNEILPGCTRNRILILAKENNYNIEERKITKDDLLSAKEVFATGSLKPIIPVVNVDGKDIFDGKVGKITAELNNLYFEFLENL